MGGPEGYYAAEWSAEAGEYSAESGDSGGAMWAVAEDLVASVAPSG